VIWGRREEEYLLLEILTRMSRKAGGDLVDGSLCRGRLSAVRQCFVGEADRRPPHRSLHQHCAWSAAKGSDVPNNREQLASSPKNGR
jgi:hypothetical protein